MMRDFDFDDYVDTVKEVFIRWFGKKDAKKFMEEITEKYNEKFLATRFPSFEEQAD